MKITYGNIGILRYKFAYFIAFYFIIFVLRFLTLLHTNA